MAMTMIREERDHETNVRRHMPRDGSAVKAGNACTKAHTTDAGALPGQKKKMRCHFRWSASPAIADVMFMDTPMTQTSPAEFQSDRRHTETDSTLRLSGAGHSRSSHLGSFRYKTVAIRLRRDPIMLCCDHCKWYCAACC